MAEDDDFASQSFRMPGNISSLPNLYDILGISRDASQDDVRRARNRLALRHHSDRNADVASDSMAHINLAYDILSNNEGRARYDAMVRGSSDDIDDFANAANKVVGVLPRGRQRSDKFKGSLQQWQSLCTSGGKLTKPSYATTFVNDFQQEVTWLVGQIPLGSADAKVQRISHPDQSYLNQLQHASHMTALFRIYDEASDLLPINRERDNDTGVAICIDRYHAILDVIRNDPKKCEQVLAAFGATGIDQLKERFFPKTELVIKRSKFRNRIGNPEQSGSKAAAAVHKQLPTHSIERANDLKCTKCSKTAGFFERLFNQSSSKTAELFGLFFNQNKFTTCQKCGKCFCYECAGKCAACNRYHCIAYCMKPCSQCDCLVCIENCLRQCSSCKLDICELCTTNKNCTGVCNQCQGIHCNKCLLSCKCCKKTYCPGFRTICQQCKEICCFSCLRRCIVCDKAICCPKMYGSSSAVCKDHSDLITKVQRNESTMWLRNAVDIASSGAADCLDSAFKMIAIASHVDPQSISGDFLMEFIESQSNLDNSLLAFERLKCELDAVGYLEIVSARFAVCLLETVTLSNGLDATDELVARSLHAVNLLRKFLPEAVGHLEGDNLDDLQDAISTARLNGQAAMEKVQTATTGNTKFQTILGKVRQACTAGYLELAVNLVREYLSQENEHAYLLEAAFWYFEANYMSQVEAQKKPIADLLEGCLQLYHARYDSSSESQSWHLRSGLKCLENAFWQGWATFDDGKLASLLVDNVVSSTKSRLALLKELLSTESDYPVFHINDAEIDAFLEPPSPIANWSDVKLRSTDLMPIRKIEFAIRKNVFTRKTWSTLDAALGYIDMLDSCTSLVEVILCFLNAALWTLKSLVEASSGCRPTKKEEEYYAKNKLLTLFTDAAMHNAFSMTCPLPLKFYTARLCGLIATRAGQVTGFRRFATRAKQHFDAALFYAPYSPSLNPPIVCVGDADILQIGYIKIYMRYLDKLESLQQSVAERLLGPYFKPRLDYFRFEFEFILANSDYDSGVMTRRLTAMASLLTNYGNLTLEHAKHFMNSPIIQRDCDGWLVVNSKLLGPLAKGGYSKINGIAIDGKSGALQLLAEEPSWLRGGQAYIAPEDVVTCFSLGIKKQHALFFSLEAPDNKMTIHPFQKCIFEPAGIADSLILHTLFHTDYLLKQFSTGVEVSAEPPFNIRPAREGFLKGLADFFISQENGILRSLRERGGHRQTHLRMWIQADELAYDVQHYGDEGLQFLFGEPKMTIRFKIMQHNIDGKSEDIEDEFALQLGEDGEEDPLQAEKQFCYDLTKHYAKLSEAFPEFRRLKEICKLFGCLRVLTGHAEMLEQQSRTFTLSQEQMRRITDEYYERYRAVEADARRQKNDALSKIEGELTWNQRQSEEAVEAVSTALSLDQYAVRRWLHNGDRSLVLDAILAKLMPPLQPPSKAEIEREQRAKIAERYRQLDRSVGDFARQCADVRQKVFGNRRLGVQPWVPAVCYQRPIPGEPNRCAIIYGGVILCPKFTQRDMPSYRGPAVGVSATWVSKVSTTMPPAPPPSPPSKTTGPEIADVIFEMPSTWREQVDQLKKMFPGKLVYSTTLLGTPRLSNERCSRTNVEYDDKGFPIFQGLFNANIPDQSRLDKLLFPENAGSISAKKRKSIKETLSQSHMRRATRELKAYLKQDHEEARRLKTKLEHEYPGALEAIEKGRPRIPGLTWHHHQTPGRLELVDSREHDANHYGGMELWHGIDVTNNRKK